MRTNTCFSNKYLLRNMALNKFSVNADLELTTAKKTPILINIIDRSNLFQPPYIIIILYWSYLCCQLVIH